MASHAQAGRRAVLADAHCGRAPTCSPNLDRIVYSCRTPLYQPYPVTRGLQSSAIQYTALPALNRIQPLHHPFVLQAMRRQRTLRARTHENPVHAMRRQAGNGIWEHDRERSRCRDWSAAARGVLRARESADAGASDCGGKGDLQARSARQAYNCKACGSKGICAHRHVQRMPIDTVSH
eukprot:2420546-Prymnesium_polylepis.2